MNAAVGQRSGEIVEELAWRMGHYETSALLDQSVDDTYLGAHARCTGPAFCISESIVGAEHGRGNRE